MILSETDIIRIKVSHYLTESILYLLKQMCIKRKLGILLSILGINY